MKIRLAVKEIQKDSIVDGEGIRSVIWTQGCRHNCLGCHNPETHSFTEGFLIEIEELKKQIDALEKQDGVTFTGGDPMEQAAPCAELAKYCQDKKLNVWCYTGYTWEELLTKAEFFPEISKFLKYIDVLVDGKFDINKKSYDAVFRGSKNQRLIDVQKSLQKRKIVELNTVNENAAGKNGRKNNYIYI